MIGHQITPAWIHSTHGRKIEAAVGQGRPIAIVSEEYWSRALLARLASMTNG